MKKKRKGGWPKRDRVNVMVRVSPVVVAWLDRIASGYGWKRGATVERVLEAVMLGSEVLGDVPGDLAPADVLDAVGGSLVDSLGGAKLLGSQVAAAVELLRKERRDHENR